MSARLVMVMLLAMPQLALSQAPPDSANAVSAFVHTVREATARYRDRHEAVVSGYRPIGPDFPGMGEHWISVPLLLDGSIDPARPPILEYADIDGVPTLVGAAFAVLLPADSAPPVGFPVPATAWHFHGGAVSEESFVSGHAHGAQAPSNKPRVAVLHVWAWLDNPEGPFATDNWALPFARLGLPVPAQAPSLEVARGLALVSGGARYYLKVMAMRDTSRVIAPGGKERLERAANEIRELLKREPLGVALQRTGGIWIALRDELGLP